MQCWKNLYFVCDKDVEFAFTGAEAKKNIGVKSVLTLKEFKRVIEKFLKAFTHFFIYISWK